MGSQLSPPSKRTALKINAVETVHFSKHSPLLAVGYNGRGLAIHEVGSWQEACLLEAPADCKIDWVQFAPQAEQVIASIGSNVTVYEHAKVGFLSLFSQPPWKPVAVLKSVGLSTSLDFAPNGRIVAVGNYLGRVVIYDTTSWCQLHEVVAIQKSGWVTAAAFSPDNLSIAVGCSTGELMLFETSSWTLQTSIQACPNDVWLLSVSFSPDGAFLAAGCQMGKLLIFERVNMSALAYFVGSWRQTTTIEPNTKSWITSVKFSPNNDCFAFACRYPYHLMIHKTRTWENLLSIEGVVHCVDFSPDGTMLAAGGDANVRIFNNSSWEVIHVLGDAGKDSKGPVSPPPQNLITNYCQGGNTQKDEIQLFPHEVAIGSAGRLESTVIKRNGSRIDTQSEGERPDTRTSLHLLQSQLTLLASSLATSMRSAPGRELEKSGVPMLPFEVVKDMCGNFSRQHELGKGAFGTVFRGTMKGTNGDIQIAVKLRRQSDDVSVVDLQEEASTLAICRHPNIVPLLAISSDKDFCIVMPLMNDGSLEHLLQDVTRLRKCGAGQRIGYARDMLNGLAYLHTPSWSKPIVLHCDIKPENVFLEGSTARIGDVGVAKCLSFWLKTATHIGTPSYCDPAIATTGQLNSASDIYSAGIVLLQIVTGNGTLKVEQDFSLADEPSKRWEQRLRICRMQYITDVRIDWPGSAAQLLHELATECTDLSQFNRPAANIAQDRLQSLLMDGPSGPPSAAQLAESGARDCVICLSAPRQGLLRPCGHYVACWTCAELIVAQGQRCPVCRGTVVRFEGGHSSQTYAGDAPDL